jgi:hypothetical protein
MTAPRDISMHSSYFQYSGLIMTHEKSANDIMVKTNNFILHGTIEKKFHL